MQRALWSRTDTEDRLLARGRRRRITDAQHRLLAAWRGYLFAARLLRRVVGHGGIVPKSLLQLSRNERLANFDQSRSG
jgi:hypothetical protein